MIRRSENILICFKFIALGCFMAAFADRVIAQSPCDTTALVPFDRIFGADPLGDCEDDTLFIKNVVVVYSLRNCSLSGFDQNGKTKWLIDLDKEYECQIVYFKACDSGVRPELKRFDAAIQLNHHRYYGLNVKKGKLRSVRLEQF